MVELDREQVNVIDHTLYMYMYMYMYNLYMYTCIYVVIKHCVELNSSY